MLNKHDNQRLLATLKSLQMQLGMVFTRFRSGAYRLFVSPGKCVDITSILNKKIDELADSAMAQKTTVSSPSSETPSAKPAQQPQLPAANVSPGHGKTTNVESDFSRYLRQRKSSEVSASGMGDKLKASAWEHIHSAIRCARHGDVASARLHSDIAGHALEEAAHYLPDAEYAELVLKVEKYFIEAHEK